MFENPIIILVEVPAQYAPKMGPEIVTAPPKAGQTYHAMLYPSTDLEVGKGKELLGTYDENWLDLLFNSNFNKTFSKIPTDKPVAAIYSRPLEQLSASNKEYVGIVTRKRNRGRGKQMTALGIMWLTPQDTISDYYVVKFHQPG